MKKGLFFLIILFFTNCKKTNDETAIVFEDFKPETAFDKCLSLPTFQLLAAAQAELEFFLKENLLEEEEDLNIAYQRYCLIWTGQLGAANMDTEVLLNGKKAKQLADNEQFKKIWSSAMAAGDTLKTEELMYDSLGNEVIIEYIEDVQVLNLKSDFYKCLTKITDAKVKNYTLTKQSFGDEPPQNIAYQFYESLELTDYNDPVLRKIIVAELYMRLIAMRQATH